MAFESRHIRWMGWSSARPPPPTAEKTASTASRASLAAKAWSRRLRILWSTLGSRAITRGHIGNHELAVARHEDGLVDADGLGAGARLARHIPTVLDAPG